MTSGVLAMANNFITTSYALNAGIIWFYNNLMFSKCANAEFDKDFLDKIYAPGQTINYRLPINFKVTSGPDITGNIQGVQERVRPLVVEKLQNVAFEYLSQEYTLDIQKEDIAFERHVKQAMRSLAEDCESFVADKMLLCNRFVGTPGTPLDKNTIDKACANLTQHGVVRTDRYTALNINDAVSVKSSLTTILDRDVVDPVLREGYIGRLFDTGVFETTKTGRHISGSGAGGSIVNGFIAAGTVTSATGSGNTLTITGLPLSTQNVFRQYDLIQISGTNGLSIGVNSVNFSDLRDTGLPAQFTVLPNPNLSDPASPNYTSDGSGNVTITISPTIVSDNTLTGVYQNITIPIPSNAPVSLLSSHNINYVYQQDAIVVAFPRIKPFPSNVLTEYVEHKEARNLVMRYSRAGDVRVDQDIRRLDVLQACTVNPEYAIRMVS